jgi:hypothetical protein
MDEDELWRSLTPVREFFSGREVTVNTVLAAYLRSRGLPVSGQPWEAAKQAMDAGDSFEEAAQLAESWPIPGTGPIPVGENQLPAPFRGRSLGWFPKQFGPGDIDGVGAKRLLGTPNIAPSWVLVREMGQNSWDARGTAPSIDFTLNLRRLTGPVMKTLRERIFTGDPPKIGLAELLQRDEVWALEVSDRGTVGLGGPIRNDLAVDPGVDTDFIDLIFNIGAPRDVYLGGGTYGFGKTIAYVASSVGTILIWSRCEGADGLEHRLIGSAIGDGFNMDKRRYTGRHWWGNVISSEDRVEPAVGAVAEELGDAVFASRFGRNSTGTSILILDPQIGGDSPRENVELLAEAVVRNLWPKLLAEQGDRSRMKISVQLDGQPIALPTIEQHPILSGYSQCLLAVRAVQADSDLAGVHLKYPVEVNEIWLRRPRKLLGHLALTRYPVRPRTDLPPTHAIALMRHQAELVVRYLERRQLDIEGFQWAGVFKPVADVDDSFALAEPPAHDDWVPEAVQDKSRRSEVKMALSRVRERADDYLLPPKPSAVSSDAPPSAAHVGDMLADLLGGLEGSAPSSRTPSSDPVGATSSTSGTGFGPSGSVGTSFPPAGAGASGFSGSGSSAASEDNAAAPGAGRRFGRPRVNLTGISYEPAQTAGWTRATVDVQLVSGPPTGASVDVLVRVGYDGGSLADTDAIRIIGWMDGPDGRFTSSPMRLGLDAVHHFVFEAQADLAVDVEAKFGGR